MKACDTNILVRFLVKDDEFQAASVCQAFKSAESAGEVLFAPLLVLLETIWVLESVYDISRSEILDAFDELLLLPVLHFEHPSTVREFVMAARKNTLDLSDVLIAYAAKRAGCDSVITFDKKAAKSELFELLK